MKEANIGSVKHKTVLSIMNSNTGCTMKMTI
jgi:hypothetical protein